MIKNFRISLLISLMGIYFSSNGITQNSTSSPYSIFGIGEVHSLGLGPVQGMGGVSIGLRPTRFYNYGNPAAVNALPSRTTMFDLGVFYKQTLSKNQATQQQTQDMNLSHFSLAFSPKPNYTLSFGLRPYSSVGYNIDTRGTIAGTSDSYQTRFTGEGGLSQLFWGNSLKINDRLSIGNQLSFIWGQISAEERVFLDTDFSNEVISNSAHNLVGFQLTTGLQYTLPLGLDKRLRLGAVFSQPFGFRGLHTESSLNTRFAGAPSEPEINTLDNLKLPFSWGLGLAFEDKNWVIGLDYTWQNWAGASLWNSTQRLNNQISAAIGVEYTPTPLLYGRKKWPALRAGFSYTDTYLNIDGTSIREYKVSAGLGLPLRKVGSINLSYAYSINGTQAEGLIQERSHVISISTTLADRWFVKRKVD